MAIVPQQRQQISRGHPKITGLITDQGTETLKASGRCLLEIVQGEAHDAPVVLLRRMIREAILMAERNKALQAQPHLLRWLRHRLHQEAAAEIPSHPESGIRLNGLDIEAIKPNTDPLAALQQGTTVRLGGQNEHESLSLIHI